LLVLAIFLLQAAAAVNGYAAWRGRPPPVPPIVLLLVVLAALTASEVNQGVFGVLWSYPLMVFTYFVLRRRDAIIFSLAMMVFLSWLTWHYIDPDLALRHFVSMLLVVVLINIVLSVISSLHQTLARQALTDPLTGCFNRRFMDQELEALVVRGKRYSVTASVLLLDIDHFKSINDTFGHGKGDEVLQKIVEIAGARIRRGDRLFRFGGEEFLLLLEQTDAEGATLVAEDIRQRIEAAELIPGHTVTVSIGVGQYLAGQSIETWTRAADAALYQAKAGGRNRVVRASPEGLASVAA
jgi:diguanylate cyclase (GGDEF)-like protein